MKVFQMLFILGFLSVNTLTGCQQTPDSCSPEIGTVSLDVDFLASNNDIPVQFPLDDYVVGYFNVRDSSGVYPNQYHAAEDYHMPAGTPVYSIADGEISFSEAMPGYGWLIIIDHPQANVYSLYGHLSPSRWFKESGNVEKGDLIAYLGDTDENGSSASYGIIEPHLHFGVRLGQRTDYFVRGDRRWQAGWTYACPESIGWLQPSQFIADYADDSYIPRDNPYKVTKLLYMAYFFGGLWVVGLGSIVLLGVLMSRQLRSHDVKETGLVKRIMPWMNIGQYKRVMARETGKLGPLFKPFLICVFLTSLAALGFIITIMILR